MEHCNRFKNAFPNFVKGRNCFFVSTTSALPKTTKGRMSYKGALINRRAGYLLIETGLVGKKFKQLVKVTNKTKNFEGILQKFLRRWFL